MKRLIFLLTVWTCFCISVAGQISKHISVEPSNVIITKASEYDKISLNNALYMDTVGHPELPVYIHSFAVPLDAQINGLRISNLNKQKQEDNYHIYPVQPPVPVSSGDSPRNFTLPDPTIYNSPLPYPGKQAEIISDELYLGYRIVTVRSYPIEYHSKSGELYFCSFDFTIDYSVQSQSSGFTVQSQSLYRHELNKKNVKFLIENPEAIDGYSTGIQKVMQGKKVVHNFSTTHGTNLRTQSVSISDETVPDYIIITNNALKPSFQTLADWKTKKGLFTVIVTTEDISAGYSGSDLQEKIRNYLLAAHSRWGDGLYVLLGGDIGIIPSRLVGASDWHDNMSYPSDKYYWTSDLWSAFKGDSYDHRIYNSNVSGGNSSFSIINILGRIPVSNAGEVAAYTDKLIAYEKAGNLEDLNYLKNNLYADAYMEYDSNNNLRSFFHADIRSYVSLYVPGTINSKFICDNAACLPIPRYTGNCPGGGGDIELNRENILSCLNTGANLGVGKFHLIYHSDHSSAVTIGISSRDKGENLTRADMDNLQNGSAYQILFSGGCHPANFTFDCFGKHYIMKPNGGGVAFIGNTDVGWQGEDEQIGDFFNALYTTPGHPSLGRYDIGSAYQNACKGSSQDKWRLHLLGEPEMQVWTGVPQNLDARITSSTAVPTGEQEISIAIDGLTTDKALICLWKDEEVYETRSVSDGTHTFTVTPETAGTLHVTVTAHNFFPVEETITVNTSDAPNLFINSVDFIDNNTNGSTGNGNGQNDAGETIFLQAVIKNNGTLTATGLNATLTCSSDSITILNGGTATLSNIASGASVTGGFRYRINKDIHEHLSNSQNPVTFTLHITGANGLSWTNSFNIDVFAPNLQQRNKIFSTSGNTVTLNVELQNMGKAPTTGLTATLKVDNVTAGTSTYLPIGTYQTQTAESPFQFTIPQRYSYDNVPLTLEVSDTYGRTWTSDPPFTLAKPVNVDGLDFASGERNIILTWKVLSPLRYNIYRSDADADGMDLDNYVRINTIPVSSGFFDDTNGLSTLTRYYYKVHAVSTTGMEGDPVRIQAWTSYPEKGMFPIQMSNITNAATMNASAHAADVNHDGYKEIFTAIAGADRSRVGYLIGLDHEGVELFDIDNNQTTYSGFAQFDASLQAPVAIGDLYGTGEMQIVSVTRDMNDDRTNHITCHVSEDSNGDLLPDMLWENLTNNSHIKGAVLANMDNSNDGSLEIVIRADGNSNGLLPDGNKIQVLDNKGNLLHSIVIAPNYSALAVADLDGDDDKEIIAGASDGIYIWHHNGTPYTANPVYGNSGYLLYSSPVVCDLDGNGKKDIILAGLKKPGSGNPTEGMIFVIRQDNTAAQGWSLMQGWGTAQTFPVAPLNLSQEVSVGDLYGDGYLEVITLGEDVAKIWDSNGTLISSTSLPGVSGALNTPVLADVDGDDTIEILAVSQTEGKLYAINPDGTSVLGFPLLADNAFSRVSPCVADVDNNGKSEIIVSAVNKVYMWETNGNPDRIEWGSERYDLQNTGEYRNCSVTVIRSNTLWDSAKEVCGNIDIASDTLTLDASCTLIMKELTTIIIRPEAHLVIDGATILEADVKALPGSSVTLKNNGKVNLRQKGKFDIPKGATFKYLRGKINVTP